MAEEKKVTKAAEEAAEGKKTVTGPVANEYVLVLSKPVKFEGKTYEKIDFSPFLNATYENMDNARRQSILQGAVNDYYMERSYTFIANLAADVLGIPVEMFLDIPIQDAMSLRNMVHRFL